MRAGWQGALKYLVPGERSQVFLLGDGAPNSEDLHSPNDYEVAMKKDFDAKIAAMAIELIKECSELKADELGVRLKNYDSALAVVIRQVLSKTAGTPPYAETMKKLNQVLGEGIVYTAFLMDIESPVAQKIMEFAKKWTSAQSRMLPISSDTVGEQVQSNSVIEVDTTEEVTVICGEASAKLLPVTANIPQDISFELDATSEEKNRTVQVAVGGTTWEMPVPQELSKLPKATPEILNKHHRLICDRALSEFELSPNAPKTMKRGAVAVKFLSDQIESVAPVIAQELREKYLPPKEGNTIKHAVAVGDLRVPLSQASTGTPRYRGKGTSKIEAPRIELVSAILDPIVQNQSELVTRVNQTVMTRAINFEIVMKNIFSSEQIVQLAGLRAKLIELVKIASESGLVDQLEIDFKYILPMIKKYSIHPKVELNGYSMYLIEQIVNLMGIKNFLELAVCVDIAADLVYENKILEVVGGEESIEALNTLGDKLSFLLEQILQTISRFNKMDSDTPLTDHRITGARGTLRTGESDLTSKEQALFGKLKAAVKITTLGELKKLTETLPFKAISCVTNPLRERLLTALESKDQPSVKPLKISEVSKLPQLQVKSGAKVIPTISKTVDITSLATGEQKRIKDLRVAATYLKAKVTAIYKPKLEWLENMFKEKSAQLKAFEPICLAVKKERDKLFQPGPWDGEKNDILYKQIQQLEALINPLKTAVENETGLTKDISDMIVNSQRFEEILAAVTSTGVLTPHQELMLCRAITFLMDRSEKDQEEWNQLYAKFSSLAEKPSVFDAYIVLRAQRTILPTNDPVLEVGADDEKAPGIERQEAKGSPREMRFTATIGDQSATAEISEVTSEPVVVMGLVP